MALYTGLALGAASIASSVYTGKKQADAAKGAARAQGQAADAATEEQRRQFDTALRLQEGERFRGNQAGNALARMLGLPEFNQQEADARNNFSDNVDQNGKPLTSLVGDSDLPVAGRTIIPKQGSTTSFDVLYDGVDVGDLIRGGANGRFLANGAPIPQLSAPGMEGKTQIPGQTTTEPSVGTGRSAANPLAEFMNSPDYQFRRDEGGRDIAQAYAARGSGRSGNALRALSEFNSNLASGEFNNRFNRLATLAGYGQNANSQGANQALVTGRGIAGSLQDAGNARASGIIGRGNAQSGLAEGVGQAAGFVPLIQDAYNQRYGGRPYAGGLTSGEINQIFAPR